MEGIAFYQHITALPRRPLLGWFSVSWWKGSSWIVSCLRIHPESDSTPIPPGNACLFQSQCESVTPHQDLRVHNSCLLCRVMCESGPTKRGLVRLLCKDHTIFRALVSETWDPAAWHFDAELKKQQCDWAGSEKRKGGGICQRFPASLLLGLQQLQ